MLAGEATRSEQLRKGAVVCRTNTMLKTCLKQSLFSSKDQSANDFRVRINTERLKYMLACRFMAELGKVVPILPIVTKSDSMTIREAATYRQEVYRKLQNPQLPEPQGDYQHPQHPSPTPAHRLCTAPRHLEDTVSKVWTE